MRRKLVVGLTLGLLVILAGAAAVVAGSDPNVAPGNRASQAVAGGCRDVAGKFDLGVSFRGAAGSRGRLCEPPQSGAAPLSRVRPPVDIPVNAEVAMYGTCDTPDGSAGCMPPVQVQTWNACERNYALYQQMPDQEGMPAPHELTRIRGVDAALFDDGRQVELYGREVTVVVFGPDAATALAAAKSVRGSVGGRAVGPQDDVPGGPPARC